MKKAAGILLAGCMVVGLTDVAEEKKRQRHVHWSKMEL